MIDVKLLVAIINGTRFSGVLARKFEKYGFIKLDDVSTEIFVAAPIAEETLSWEALNVGTRLRFCLRESTHHKGKLVAGRVARETKI